MSLPSAELLCALADAADAETLPRFRSGLYVDNKLSEGFDPVTDADRAAESAIRDVLARERPQDGILGEEFGTSGPQDRLWVIDPIDGTRAFISGVPVWGTLIGYCEGGVARAGIMSQPFTGERFVADGQSARSLHHGRSSPIKVRGTRDLADATLFTTSPRLFEGAALARFEALEASVRLTRFSIDCYAFCLLGAGCADLVVETGLKPYDIVALVPIIEQAGGVVTTFAGGRPEGGGDIVAAATPELHAAALALLGH